MIGGAGVLPPPPPPPQAANVKKAPTKAPRIPTETLYLNFFGITPFLFIL
jgi:hypothetical protein